MKPGPIRDKMFSTPWYSPESGYARFSDMGISGGVPIESQGFQADPGFIVCTSSRDDIDGSLDQNNITQGDSSQSTLSPQSLANARPTPVEGHQCKECGVVFNHRAMLETHALEKGHGAYACEINGCEKKFGRRDTFRRHQATMHRDQPKSLKCIMCARQFKRRDGLTQHRRRGRCSRKPWECGEC
jgi:hypothetical protein